MAGRDRLGAALAPFKAARRERQLAFFVGAGVSRNAPASRPLAGEITRALAETLLDRSVLAHRWWRRETIVSRVQRLRFESLMQLLADANGDLRFLRALRGGRPNSVHRGLARALLAGCPVLTTNFDCLIERALPHGSGIDVLFSPAHFAAGSTTRGMLAKLHGSLADLDSLGATIRSIGALGAAFAWAPERGAFLDQIRARHPMAVFGYSGSDDADIVPRLRMTPASQPLLWVFHGDEAPRLAGNAEVKRLARGPGLLELLTESRAITVVGRTAEVFHEVADEGRRPAKPAAARPFDPASAFRRTLGRTRHRWFADFTLARIFYEAGFRAAALRLSSGVRERLRTGSRLAALCRVNEAAVLGDLGRWQEAAAVAGPALAPLQRWGDGRALVYATMNLALALERTGRGPEADAVLQSLLARIEPDAELAMQRAKVLANLADRSFESGRFGEARDYLARLLATCRQTGDLIGMSSFFGIAAKISFAEDNVADALRLNELAAAHARTAGDRGRDAALWNNRGTMLRAGGLSAEARAAFETARRIGRTIGDADVVAVAEMGLVTVDLVEDRFETAVQRATQALSHARELGLADLAAQTEGNLALAMMKQGRHREALSHLETVSDHYREHGPTDFAAFTWRNIAECLTALGRADEAADAEREAALLEAGRPS